MRLPRNVTALAVLATLAAFTTLPALPAYADAGTETYIVQLKSGVAADQKIDFAVMRDGQVQMLIEAKKIGEPLNLMHGSQLVRYFHVSNARIGVLTNGREWNFYTDLDKPNVMDGAPFLRLDLLDIDPYILPDLKKLTKDTFDLDSVLLAAEELKYVSALKRQGHVVYSLLPVTPRRQLWSGVRLLVGLPL
jgi:hypothetical protein